MSELDQIIEAMQWAADAYRIEYSARLKQNASHCDLVDTYHHALALARSMRARAVVRYADRDEINDPDDPFWYLYRTPKHRDLAEMDQKPRAVVLIPEPTEEE